MRSLVVALLLPLASISAGAQTTFSFVIDGQPIRFGITRGCNDLSCISIDVPGYISHDGRRAEPRRPSRKHASKPREAKRAKAKPAAPAVAAAPTPTSKSAMVREPAPEPATRSVAPAVPAEPTPGAAIAEPAPEQAAETKVAAVPMPAQAPMTRSIAPADPSSSASRQSDQPKSADEPVAAPLRSVANDTAEPVAPKPTSKSAMVRELAPEPATRGVAPAVSAVPAEPKPRAAIAEPAPEQAAEVKVAAVPVPTPAPARTTRGIAPADPSDSASRQSEEPKSAAEPVTAPAPSVAANPAEPVAPSPSAESPAVTKPKPPTVIAALPPPMQEVEQPAKPAPIGLWSGSDGRLRIEPCGQYLCGYAGGGKNAGKQVLINMRQTKSNVWVGRVRDFQSGGIYSATMTLRGDNSLRIQGCAFGGMICGGRTLARVN